MTLQKAMRVRAELKKEAAKLTEILTRTSFELTWEGEKPDAEALIAKRNEKRYSLNGLTFKEAVDKLFRFNEECQKINIAIEDANAQGHKLIYKEACLKSKLGFINLCLHKEKNIDAYTTKYQTSPGHYTQKESENTIKIDCYNYPIFDESCFGKSLLDMKKQLSNELEDVRDELSAFNAKSKICYELPEDLL